MCNLILTPRRLRGLSAILACLTFAAADASACAKWDLSSTLTIKQANGANVTLSRITRDGKKFEASAKYAGGRGDAAGSVDTRGRFKFNIDWDNGSVGVYTAHVEESGEVVDGRTYDRSHPASWSTWTSDNLSGDD